jgi:hypothetical protein
VSGGELDRERVEAICRERVEAICIALLFPIRDHLARGKPGRHKVHEVLNALAAVTALVVIGAGDDADHAEEWFQVALRQQIEQGAE